VLSHLHDAIGTNASSSGRVMKNYEARKVAEAAAQRNTSMQNYLAHSIEQQQAALALAQLAGKEPEVTLSEGKVHALIYSLASEAPPNVIAAMANADPPPPSHQERAQLEMLQRLIQRRLGA
jgi:hypothetical protein